MLALERFASTRGRLRLPAGLGWIMTTLKSVLLSTCYIILLSLGATFNLAVNLVTL